MFIEKGKAQVRHVARLTLAVSATEVDMSLNGIPMRLLLVKVR
jgi:hypothetical protein